MEAISRPIHDREFKEYPDAIELALWYCARALEKNHFTVTETDVYRDISQRATMVSVFGEPAHAPAATVE